MSDLIKALGDVRTHLRTVLVSICPDEHKVQLREALEIVDNAIGNSDGWSEHDTYAGLCDGERWVETVEAFETAARRHRECGSHRKSAAELADRMAATTHDVRPDQMMAAAEFLVAEWSEHEDWDPETGLPPIEWSSGDCLVLDQRTRPHFSRILFFGCPVAI